MIVIEINLPLRDSDQYWYQQSRITKKKRLLLGFFQLTDTETVLCDALGTHPY